MIDGPNSIETRAITPRYAGVKRRAGTQGRKRFQPIQPEMIRARSAGVAARTPGRTLLKNGPVPPAR